LLARELTTDSDAGALVYADDKWDEKEPEKGHRLIDYAGRCVNIPDAPAAPKYTGDSVGKDEYMPDGSWKGSGTCIHTYKNGDKLHEAWEEGSQLKAYPYKLSDGTGKHQGVSGGGTYFYEQVTDALSAGTYKGQLVLP
jgi:hypothetical protein